MPGEYTAQAEQSNGKIASLCCTVRLGENTMSVYRFGPFEARTHTGELYKFGTKLALRGQPFQILRVLLNRPGDVVTREEVRDELWPSDTFVDFEHGINASLRKLRVALGDSAVKPLYVETLPGQGYRFIAPLVVVEEALVPPSPANTDPPVALDEEEEESEREVFEVNPGNSWWSGMLLGLAVGGVVFGLLFFATRTSRRMDEGVAAKVLGVASSAVAPEPDVPTHKGSAATTAPAQRFSLRALATPASSPIHGKVWVVSVPQASHVAFPPPNAAPDATFITRGVAYIGSAPKNCYSLVSFLVECGIGGFDLKFSGLDNANLGGRPAGPGTAMSGKYVGHSH
jgi:DNA-binding winged helix-turn-helix (wHTH) protein